MEKKKTSVAPRLMQYISPRRHINKNMAATETDSFQATLLDIVKSASPDEMRHFVTGGELKHLFFLFHFLFTNANTNTQTFQTGYGAFHKFLIRLFIFHLKPNHPLRNRSVDKLEDASSMTEEETNIIKEFASSFSSASKQTKSKNRVNIDVDSFISGTSQLQQIPNTSSNSNNTKKANKTATNNTTNITNTTNNNTTNANNKQLEQSATSKSASVMATIDKYSQSVASTGGFVDVNASKRKINKNKKKEKQKKKQEEKIRTKEELTRTESFGGMEELTNYLATMSNTNTGGNNTFNIIYSPQTMVTAATHPTHQKSGSYNYNIGNNNNNNNNAGGRNSRHFFSQSHTTFQMQAAAQNGIIKTNANSNSSSGNNSSKAGVLAQIQSMSRHSPAALYQGTVSPPTINTSLIMNSGDETSYTPETGGNSITVMNDSKSEETEGMNGIEMNSTMRQRMQSRKESIWSGVLDINSVCLCFFLFCLCFDLILVLFVCL